MTGLTDESDLEQCRAFGTKTKSFIGCCHRSQKCIRLGVFLHWKVLKSHSLAKSVFVEGSDCCNFASFVRFADQIICFTCLHREWLRWGIKLETASVEDLSEAGLKCLDSHVSSKTGFLTPQVLQWHQHPIGEVQCRSMWQRPNWYFSLTKHHYVIYLQGFFQKKGPCAFGGHTGVECVPCRFQSFPGSELIQGVLGMQCATEVPSSAVSNS